MTKEEILEKLKDLDDRLRLDTSEAVKAFSKRYGRDVFSQDVIPTKLGMAMGTIEAILSEEGYFKK